MPSKEHPLIFNSDMVKAILEGRKTQTRRVIKMPEGIAAKYEYMGNDGGNGLLPKKSGHYWMNGYAMWRPDLCSFGEVGDKIWVRESLLLQREKDTQYFDTLYRADNVHIDNLHELDDWFEKYALWYDSGKAKQIVPSIHMPKWAARIWLEITGLRVERVQDISEADSLDEGVETNRGNGAKCRRDFAMLWDSIYAKRGYGWDKNPYCRVIEFKRTK